MEFLYFLESIRNPVCDFFFETITHFGEETLMLVLAIVFFWCINKREGYYILFVTLIGLVINQMAKLVFRIDRPWVKDPNFTVVGNAKDAALGYSFPSGHTQTIAGSLGALAAFNCKKRWIVVVSTVIIALVAFSRMYLGVHTLADVLFSLVVALILVVALRPLFSSDERTNKILPYIVLSAIALTLIFVVYVYLYRNDTTLDPHNYASAIKCVATLVGSLVGMLVVYFVDKYHTNFSTEAPWYIQIFKLVVGLGIVLAIKSGLSAPLNALFGNEQVARGVRYFLIISFAGAVWPLTFKRLAAIRIASLDRFGERVAALISRKKDGEGDAA